MATQNVASLQIDPALISGLATNVLSAQIAQALGDPTELIRKVVEHALSVKVGEDGNKAQYDSGNRYNFVEAVAGKALRDKCTELIRRYVADNSEQLKNYLREELVKPENTKRLALALLASAEKAITEKAFFFKIEVERSNDY